MAVEVPIANDERGYNGKITCIVILSCMVAATGGIIFGYDIGISGMNIYLNFILLMLLVTFLLWKYVLDCKILVLFLSCFYFQDHTHLLKSLVKGK